MTDRRVALVTGVCGQDGRYLAERLLGDGTIVHGLVRPGSPAPEGVVAHEGDLTDTSGVRRLLLDIAPDEIYNLAAVTSVARSWDQPDLVAAVNGTAAVALLDSAYRLQESAGRPVRFVQASSAEIFGSPAHSPQDESTAIAPVNPYGVAKAYAHLMAGVYRTRGLPVSSLVLYNHESPRRPERFVTRKITAGVAAIAAGRSERLVLGNLDARRDWGWAPDYVDAMVRAARAEAPDDFVVATGAGRTVREFVDAAFAAVGIPAWERYVDVDPALFRPVDAVDLVGNAARAERVLGWRPSVTFEELVRRMVAAEA